MLARFGSVVASMWLITVPVAACNSIVVNTPTQTIAHPCNLTIIFWKAPNPFFKPEMLLTDDKPVYQYDTPRASPPKAKKVKKKCWYKTKKGKKRYRMRYKC